MNWNYDRSRKTCLATDRICREALIVGAGKINIMCVSLVLTNNIRSIQILKKTGTISHIELYVRNLKETRNFWEWLLIDKLNYQLFQKWADGVSYRFDDTYIVFVQTDKIEPKYNRTAVGLNHLAFYVESPQTVDFIRQEVHERGYSELYADSYPHASGNDVYTLFFEDPDRIKVEIVSDEKRKY